VDTWNTEHSTLYTTLHLGELDHNHSFYDLGLGHAPLSMLLNVLFKFETESEKRKPKYEKCTTENDAKINITKKYPHKKT